MRPTLAHRLSHIPSWLLRAILLGSLLLFPALSARSARDPSCDACQSIQGQIVVDNAQIITLQQQSIGSFGKPGEPLKPVPHPPDPEVEAIIRELRNKIELLTQQFKECHKPSPNPPPLAFKPLTVSGVGTPDPQVAVGRKYVATLSTSTLVFLDKSTRTPVTSGLGFPNSNGVISLTSVFESLFKALDEEMHLPKDRNVCVTHSRAFDETFDPKHPDRAIPGCVYEAYDTRVLYDEARHRFWIEAAARHPLYRCPRDGPPFTGADIGPFLKHSDGTLDDPAPGGDPKLDAKCHNDWNPNWIHRFVVVAVTQVDDHGREDLSKPPYVYALFDDLGDWPLMSLHDNYLVLTHFDTNAAPADPIAIFDADRLAHPHPGDDGSAMKIKPLAIFNIDDLTVKESGSKLVPESVIYPVNTRSSSGRTHFLISYSGDSLLILGFRSPEGNLSGTPEKLIGTSVPLGPNHNTPRHNPEFRDGMIHIAWQECDEVTPCKRTMIRVLRIPVGVENGRIFAATDPTQKFLDCRFTDEDEKVSLTLPMLTVNKNDDMVVAFERDAPDERISTGVRFRVWYHDHANISDGAWIKEGETVPAGQSIPVPPTGVDLGGIDVDPDDDTTVWMSHAYGTSSGGFEQVVTAAKP